MNGESIDRLRVEVCGLCGAAVWLGRGLSFPISGSPASTGGRVLAKHRLGFAPALISNATIATATRIEARNLTTHDAFMASSLGLPTESSVGLVLDGAARGRGEGVVRIIFSNAPSWGGATGTLSRRDSKGKAYLVLQCSLASRPLRSRVGGVSALEERAIVRTGMLSSA